MKKLLSFLIFLLMLSAASCDFMSDKTIKADVESLEETTVSIYNAEETTGEIKSYQASVTSYYMDNRHAVDLNPQQEYRISMKIIDNELYTRLDFSGDDFPDRRARTMITSPEETVIMFTGNNSVESRFPVGADTETFDYLTNRIPMIGRVDFDKLNSLSQRLSFDVTDDEQGLMSVKVPPSGLRTLIGTEDVKNISLYRLNFDTNDQVLTSSEMVTVDDDGVIRTTISYPIYQESGDELIQKGTLTEVINDYPFYGDSEISTEVYNSEEDIPEISEAELAQLERDGVVIKEMGEPLLGDPNDPDYTETFVDFYEEIELNTLSDSFFRITM